MAGAFMAAQITSNYSTYILNREPVSVSWVAALLPMINRHVVDSLVSEEHEELVNMNNNLYTVHSELKGIIDLFMCS